MGQLSGLPGLGRSVAGHVWMWLAFGRWRRPRLPVVLGSCPLFSGSDRESVVRRLFRSCPPPWGSWTSAARSPSQGFS